MKIIKTGKVDKSNYSWVGLTIVCPECKVEFVMEEGDPTLFDMGREACAVICPTEECRNILSFRDYEKKKDSIFVRLFR